MQYLILDTETVGLAEPKDHASGVVEIAWVEIDPVTLEPINKFSSRIHPECAVGQGASAVHGIYLSDVKDCPKLSEVFAPKGPVTIIGHNIAFDLKFVSKYIENLAGQLCTLRLARKLIPDAPRHKLETLANYLRFPAEDAHSAVGDVNYTLKLLQVLVPASGRSLVDLVAADSSVQILHTMPFGKHKGEPLVKLPTDYVKWFLAQDIEAGLRYSLEQVLKIRGLT